MSLMGWAAYDWQDADYVLGNFGSQAGAARQSYLEFLVQEREHGRQSELTGGGLIRSAGGWSEVLSKKSRGERRFSDERILGGGEFSQGVIDEAEATVRDKVPLVKRWSEIGELVDRVCEQHGVNRQSLENGCRRKACSEVRKAAVRKLVFELGVPYAETARLLGVSASAVSKMVSSFAGL